MSNSMIANLDYGVQGKIDFLKTLDIEQFILNPLKDIEFKKDEESIIVCLYGSGSCIIGKKNNSFRRDDIYLIKSNYLLKVFNNSDNEYMCFLKITNKG